MCLWHWKERFDFFSKLSIWGHYGEEDGTWHGNTRNAEDLRGFFGLHLPQYEGWDNRILGDFVGSPVHKFLSESSESYDSFVFYLVRLIRNLYQHITERKKDFSRDYIYIYIYIVTITIPK